MGNGNGCGTGHSDAVRALAVANDRLFSGSYDGTVKVWDVHTMECLQTLAGHTGPVRTLVYSGGHMFSGSYDKTVRPTRLHAVMSQQNPLHPCCSFLKPSHFCCYEAAGMFVNTASGMMC